MQSSPLARTFAEAGGPTSDPSNLAPTSIPTNVQQMSSASASLLALPLGSLSALSDGPISPISWQAVDPLSPYHGLSPGSDGYVTVSQLAQKVFDGNDYSSLAYQTAPASNVSISSQSPPLDNGNTASTMSQLLGPVISGRRKKSPLSQEKTPFSPPNSNIDDRN